MKHFRDLVLSTKEPALHNVLWIEPVDIDEYIVKMYEDGWKPLFGGGGADSHGLWYKDKQRLPDGSGYVVQLMDDYTDPTNPANIYPRTRAAYVTLSNGIDIETALNNINLQLNSITSMIKKAKFVTELPSVITNGEYYWVYSQYNDSKGEYIGENFIRHYTSASQYDKIELSTTNIVMKLDNSAELGYVSAMNMSSVKRAIITVLPTKYDITSLINTAMQTVVTDIQIDGDSVVVNGVANISKGIRKVYLVTDDIFNGDYRNNRANKTFLLRSSNNLTDQIQLYKYDDTGLDENRTEIPLHTGDLLFNIDDHASDNSDFIPNALYIYNTPQERIKVHPFATINLVNHLIASSIDAFRQAYIDNLDTTYAHLDYVEAESDDSIQYKALKQGEEQMVVLKSMDKLDVMPIPDEYLKYDLNDDGIINDIEISMLYTKILVAGGIYKYSDDEWYTITDENNDLVVKRSVDQGNSWTIIAGKDPDINNDGYITATDVTAMYAIIDNIAETYNINYDRDEFTGNKTLFAIYRKGKIKIGYNYNKYLESGGSEDYILETFDPSPNVLYCNSFNNQLYRWNAYSEKMVEINLSMSATITRLQKHMQALETYVTSQGGTIYIDE